MQNYIFRKFASTFVGKIIEKGKKFAGSPWEKAVKSNPEFYDWVD
jgi:hypothetical protein